MFLNQLYKPFIGINVNKILSYLVKRNRGVLSTDTRTGAGWVGHPSIRPIG
jgi:hypothetical protein